MHTESARSPTCTIRARTKHASRIMGGATTLLWTTETIRSNVIKFQQLFQINEVNISSWRWNTFLSGVLQWWRQSSNPSVRCQGHHSTSKNQAEHSQGHLALVSCLTFHLIIIAYRRPRLTRNSLSLSPMVIIRKTGYMLYGSPLSCRPPKPIQGRRFPAFFCSIGSRPCSAPLFPLLFQLRTNCNLL